MRSNDERADAATPATPLRAVLAFDTSTDRMSVALEVDGRTWALDEAGGAQASASLIPAVMGLLARAGQTLAGLQAIAFGRGPGAFTGLRTACSVAQGLAFGSDRPVLPIDTLMAVAEDARLADAGCVDVWATLDARMDEVYAAHYRIDWSADADAGTDATAAPDVSPSDGSTASSERAGARWQVLRAPALYPIDALNAVWASEPPSAIAGNALGAFGDRLSTGAAVLHPAARPQALGMLALARAAWAAGDAVDAAQALPLYLRDKVALTTVERAEVKASKLAADHASRMTS